MRRNDEAGLRQPGPATINATTQQHDQDQPNPTADAQVTAAHNPAGWSESDDWQDRDGKVYRGPGPYYSRPTRVLRRWLRPHSMGWRG